MNAIKERDNGSHPYHTYKQKAYLLHEEQIGNKIKLYTELGRYLELDIPYLDAGASIYEQMRAQFLDDIGQKDTLQILAYTDLSELILWHHLTHEEVQSKSPKSDTFLSEINRTTSLVYQAIYPPELIDHNLRMIRLLLSLALIKRDFNSYQELISSYLYFTHIEEKHPEDINEILELAKIVFDESNGNPHYLYTHLYPKVHTNIADYDLVPIGATHQDQYSEPPHFTVEDDTPGIEYNKDDMVRAYKNSELIGEWKKTEELSDNDIIIERTPSRIRTVNKTMLDFDLNILRLIRSRIIQINGSGKIVMPLEMFKEIKLRESIYEAVWRISFIVTPLSSSKSYETWREEITKLFGDNILLNPGTLVTGYPIFTESQLKMYYSSSKWRKLSRIIKKYYSSNHPDTGAKANTELLRKFNLAEMIIANTLEFRKWQQRIK